ncbi:MAG: hypothetical protein K6T59_11595 [Bryobacteraceae bacterium]|nr:hypothetical protein [Bryobacteraceae bacterium]
MPTFRERIPNLTTRAERERCRAWVKYQPGGSTVQQAQLLVKILAVLKWWYHQIGRSTDPMRVIESFARSLGREGASLVLEPMPASRARYQERREQDARVTDAARTLARRAGLRRRSRRRARPKGKP